MLGDVVHSREYGISAVSAVEENEPSTLWKIVVLRWLPELISLGVPLPTVSRRLGHASVNVTATIYAHALPNDEKEAANVWAEGMKAAKESDPVEQAQRKFRVIRGRRTA